MNKVLSQKKYDMRVLGALVYTWIYLFNNTKQLRCLTIINIEDFKFHFRLNFYLNYGK